MSNVALNKKIEEPVRNAAEATDGQITGYDGQHGFASFIWPGTLTVDLEKVFSIRCVRFLIWDNMGKAGNVRTSRDYKYRLLTSKDHKQWEVVYDSSAQGTNGWQVFTFPRGLDTRYVRIYGLWNSGHTAIQIVQIEAHDSEPPELMAQVMTEKSYQPETATIEAGDGFPIEVQLRDTITKMEAALGPYLKQELISGIIDQLRSQTHRVASIERSMDAIRREVTEPVKKELEASGRMNLYFGRFSKWGFLVGLIGGILAIISIIQNLYMNRSSTAKSAPVPSTISSPAKH